MTDNTPVGRVTRLVAPIVADLHLDLYDVEMRGGVLRITIDTPVGTETGVDLEQIALVSRLLGRELDFEDPMPGHYTLEVSSPGLERGLRTAEHFQREIGKKISVRLREVANGERRLQGTLTAADDDTITVLTDGGEERTIALSQIDRAKTVFEWGPAPKPGKAPKAGPGTGPRSETKSRTKTRKDKAETTAESTAGQDQVSVESQAVGEAPATSRTEEAANASVSAQRPVPTIRREDQ
jgi:ribosome maturation factor RimP